MEDEIDLRKVFPPATGAVTSLVREKIKAIRSENYRQNNNTVI